MNEYDVVIVGGGAAGLSAALVLTRARRRVAVMDAGVPRNAPAAHMHGFLSRDGMPPAELLAVGRAEVTGYGGRIIDATVVGIEPGFQVRLADATTLRARRVLVTTGLRDELPDLPGVRQRWGRDLLHCPYCHGHEVRDRPLGVLGGTPDAVVHALLVRQWSADVVFFAHTHALTGDEREQLAARGVRVVEGTVARLVHDGDRLRGVELVGGEAVARDAVFVRPRFVPRDDLLTGLGCAVHDNGWVAVDPTGRTSVPGVWAAGNAVDPRAQVVTAAGAGSAAAIALNADLVADDVRRAVTARRDVTDAFSPELERQVAAVVLGERAHGFPTPR
ncbi:NAD(P)/FAD-dependent oxidoreductase [Catellatospora sp. KI3]|uniref:NAD(P)/FAD-dependent oxidoreductase n=1 Tax=Catellatospora sp. KI3 TaxID=3041620 RepID=UPI00248214DA|nr:NAD(P)/FAD-dependent oxidoreductase [Catellatospora sp. KI3]MDI1463247.1 NAD(P)/FAD-dependent oxidoreductase [Catellatospora sp. KI3]